MMDDLPKHLGWVTDNGEPWVVGPLDRFGRVELGIFIRKIRKFELSEVVIICAGKMYLFSTFPRKKVFVLDFSYMYAEY